MLAVPQDTGLGMALVATAPRPTSRPNVDPEGDSDESPEAEEARRQARAALEEATAAADAANAEHNLAVETVRALDARLFEARQALETAEHARDEAAHRVDEARRQAGAAHVGD